MILNQLLFELFVNRTNAYSEAHLAEGGRMAYAKKDIEITPEILQLHLDGEMTVGIYQLNKAGHVKWGVYDFDLDTKEDFESACRLYKYLRQQGYHPLMENSGGGEFKTHIWIFADADALSIKTLMEDKAKECEVVPHEIFPKQTEVGEDGYGNLVKVPLALHLASGRRSYFFNDKLEPEMNISELLQFHIENKDTMLVPKVIIKEKTIVIGSPKELEAGEMDCAFMNYCLTHQLPKGKRHEVISRNMAWYVTHHPQGPMLKEQYCKVQDGAEHELDGWLKGIEKGKGIPVACGELVNYQREFKIPVKCRGCPRWKDYLAEKRTQDELKKKITDEVNEENAKKEGFLLDSFNNFTNCLGVAKEFIKSQPIYYDSAKNWWVWNFETKCYVMMDETDILNFVDSKTKNPSVRSQSKNEIIEALKRVGRKSKPKDWNKHWIQFRNKIIDYRTEEEMEISHDYFSTNPIPWNVGETEDTPTIDKLFSEWVGKEYIRTLYEFLAFCLVSDYPLHRILALIGSGANGKGTFLRLLEKLLGKSNVCTSELEAIAHSRFEASRLYKKLVCFMSETNFDELSSTAQLKKLTGQDLIPFEFKNKDLFHEYSYAKLIIATNSLPPTTDKTIGFYRRWLVIDFPYTFREEKDILATVPDSEYENLCRKCIRLIRELLERHVFHNEGDFEQRQKRYEEKSNPLDKFLEEEISMDDMDAAVPKWEFEKRLNDWCRENRHRILTDKTINKRLKEKNIVDGKIYQDFLENGVPVRKQIRAWVGVKWKD